jgi:hypothetical protein
LEWCCSSSRIFVPPRCLRRVLLFLVSRLLQFKIIRRVSPYPKSRRNLKLQPFWGKKRKKKKSVSGY